jgi:hypothetical protein
MQKSEENGRVDTEYGSFLKFFPKNPRFVAFLISHS